MISRDESAVPDSEIARLHVAKKYSGDDMAILERALLVDALPNDWKSCLQQRLQFLSSQAQITPDACV